MRGLELYEAERESIDQIDWPESVFDIDDQSFAAAIAAGRDESWAA